MKPSIIFQTTSRRRVLARCAKSLAVFVFFCCGSMLLAAPSAWAFGCQAHQIVALIAEKHLSPHALAMIEKILKDNPIDPALSRYCQQGGLDAIADSANWADDYRSAHRETGSWHFIDIPLVIDKGNLADYCPPSEGCVTQAIKDQIALLRAQHTDPQTRANALRFVIHLVGDLHQPLHVSDNNDLGGNCVPVTFFGEEPKLTNEKYESYAPNLHGMWDYGIYQREFKDKSMSGSAAEYKTGFKDQNVEQSATEFDNKFRSDVAAWMRAEIDIDAWTWESFRIAKTIVYGKLPVAIAPEPPAGNHSCSEDNHISTRMLKLHEDLEQPYQDVALPVYEQQIAKAGARLALILNQIWP